MLYYIIHVLRSHSFQTTLPVPINWFVLEYSGIESRQIQLNVFSNQCSVRFQHTKSRSWLNWSLGIPVNQILFLTNLLRLYHNRFFISVRGSATFSSCFTLSYLKSSTKLGRMKFVPVICFTKREIKVWEVRKKSNAGNVRDKFAALLGMNKNYKTRKNK